MSSNCISDPAKFLFSDGQKYAHIHKIKLDMTMFIIQEGLVFHVQENNIRKPTVIGV